MEDLDRVNAIVRAAGRHLDDLGIPQWDDIYPGEAIVRTDVERGELWVIEADGDVAGLVSLNEDQSPEYRDVPWRFGGKVLVVHRLAVDPARQRRGLAAALMTYAEQEAAAREYDAIRLDVFTRNPAATALYERRGYRRAGTVRFRKGLFFCYERPVR